MPLTYKCPSPFFFHNCPSQPELNPSTVHRTRWPSAGVQTRFRSDWRFLFTGLSLRIGSWRPRNGTGTHSRPHEGVCPIFIGPVERELETETSSTARGSAIASDAENRRTIKRKIALSLLSLMRLMTRPSTVTKMAIEFRSIVGESQSLDKAHMGGPMLRTYRSSYRTHLLHILFAAAASVYLTDYHDRINECPALLACPAMGQTKVVYVYRSERRGEGSMRLSEWRLCIWKTLPC